MKNLKSVTLSGHEIIDQYLINRTPALYVIQEDERLPRNCQGETFIAILAELLDDESFHKVIKAHYPNPEDFPRYSPIYDDGLVEIGLRRGVWLDYCKQALKDVAMISYHNYKDYIDMLARHGLEHLKELDDYGVPNEEYVKYIKQKYDKYAKQKIKLLENPQAAYNEFPVTDSPYLFA